MEPALRGRLATEPIYVNLASTIKTQILRVERQLDQLSKAKETPDPNVPVLDEGGVETTPKQPPVEDTNDNPSPQDPADPPTDDADNTGKFFGLPLE